MKETLIFTLTGLFVALVAVSTMVIHVPVVATGGFVNVGDTMIFVAAILLGEGRAVAGESVQPWPMFC